ncbi:MAG: response regulator [Elusimicrobia bacterium]|nr:response regulator [Elusimicrobiota bacterium]
MKQGKILVVDDEEGIRELLVSEFSSLGYNASSAVNGEEAANRIESERFDIIISDMKMPKLSGLELLKKVKAVHPSTEVIIVTGYATIENALEVMKAGAYDFVQKPFNIDEVTLLVERAFEKSELKTLVALYESSNAIFSNTKLEELLPIMTKLIKKNTLADDVAIFLSDASEQFSLESASFELNSGRKKIFTSFMEKFVERAIANPKLKNEPLITNASSGSDFLEGAFFENTGIKSFLTYPIMLNGNVLGFLLLSKNVESSTFAQTDLDNLSIFVSQIAQAIANVRLYEKLELKISEMQQAYDALVKVNTQLDALKKAFSLKHFTEKASYIADKVNYIASKTPQTPELSGVSSDLQNKAKQLVEDLAVLSVNLS